MVPCFRTVNMCITNLNTIQKIEDIHTQLLVILFNQSKKTIQNVNFVKESADQPSLFPFYFVVQYL